MILCIGILKLYIIDIEKGSWRDIKVFNITKQYLWLGTYKYWNAMHILLNHILWKPKNNRKK